MSKKRKPSNLDQNKVWEKEFGKKKEALDVTKTKITKQGYGKDWEIDHLKPKSKGGKDIYKNVRPLSKKENRTKSDDYPTWTDTKGKKHTEKKYNFNNNFGNVALPISLKIDNVALFV